MIDDHYIPEHEEPDTESSDHAEDEAPTEDREDEAPTEDREGVASDTQASELATMEVLAGEVEELRAHAAERNDYFDKLQRSRADFVNYQKRVQRERERWSDMAVQNLVQRLLPALDDLERALGAARDDHDVAAFVSGIELIHAKMLKGLSEEGVKPFDAMGKPFDPAFHEAVAYHEQPNVADQTIIEVVQRGYMIGDRVLRAAKVVVAKGH